MGSIPVCEGDKLVGMITDRDITVRSVAAGQMPDRCVVISTPSRPDRPETRH